MVNEIVKQGDEGFVEIYDYFNKEKDIWRRTHKNGEIIFEVQLSKFIHLLK